MASRRSAGPSRRAIVAHLTAFRFAPTREIADYSQRPRAWKAERPRATGARRVPWSPAGRRRHHARRAVPASLPPDALESYLEDSSRLTEPCIFDQTEVRSASGAAVHLSFVGLTLTSHQIARALDGSDRDWIMRKLESAVALARDQGNQVVGFGGYTSIVSANCRRVQDRRHRRHHRQLADHRDGNPRRYARRRTNSASTSPAPAWPSSGPPATSPAPMPR